MAMTTTVTNVSAVERYLEFLPPYGGRLASGASFTAEGTVYDWVQRGDYHPDTPGRRLKSFDYALSAGWITIVNPWGTGTASGVPDTGRALPPAIVGSPPWFILVDQAVPGDNGVYELVTIAVGVMAYVQRNTI
jgi:hypothetical protein